MERKSVNVYESVKDILKDLKSSKLRTLSNESEIIAYLYALYESKYEHITLPEHEKLLQRVKELHKDS